MVFTKRLREGVKRGEITCSVRIWMSPRVRVAECRFAFGFTLACASVAPSAIRR